MGTPVDNDHDLLIVISTKMDLLLTGREQDRTEYEATKKVIWDRLRELDMKVVKLTTLSGIGGTICGTLLSAGFSFLFNH
jgi:hypothetical protein